MKRASVALMFISALALTACLTDPLGTKPEVKIDKEKVEQTKRDRAR